MKKPTEEELVAAAVAIGQAAAGWSDFPARQEAARKQGRYIGLGLSNYVEGTGRGPFESVSAAQQAMTVAAFSGPMTSQAS